VKAKICGITSLDDATMCEEEGADAIGFVHFPGRGRSLPLAMISEIMRSIGPLTTKILVCDPKNFDEAARMFDLSGADMLQVYSLPPEVLQEFRDAGGSVIRAVKPDSSEALKYAGSADALLFEAGIPGTGASYDYSSVPTECCVRSIIAGGLRIDNMQAAKARKPYALDVSSGVESSPGKKDRAMVSEFIRRCRE